jgi:hypothetical protein
MSKLHTVMTDSSSGMLALLVSNFMVATIVVSVVRCGPCPRNRHGHSRSARKCRVGTLNTRLHQRLPLALTLASA